MCGMFRLHRLVLPAVVALTALTAAAQEYGRASGGELQMFRKQSSTLAGTLGFRLGSGKGFEGSGGGTLINDRMWFFASVARDHTTTVPAELKVNAQLDPQQLVNGSYVKTTPLLAVPQSFLSLHYTGVISSNAFVTASVSSSRR